MKLGINLEYFCRDKDDGTFPDLCKTAVLLKDHGFSELDFLTNIRRNDWREHASAFRAFADNAGITVHQTHCPFNRYHPEVPDEDFLPLVSRAVDASAILGAKYMVIHADEYRLAAGEEYSSEKICAAMYDRFAPFVEQAKKQNVGIAIENLFEDGCFGNGGRSRYTSTIEELLSLVERFADPDVTVCWDFGHAHVAFGNDSLAAFQQALPHLSCTHVHDNTHGDQHLIPYLGTLDWTGHLRAMKEQGYSGNLTYESVYGHIPDALLPAYLDYIRAVGEHLLSL